MAVDAGRHRGGLAGRASLPPALEACGSATGGQAGLTGTPGRDAGVRTVGSRGRPWRPNPPGGGRTMRRHALELLDGRFPGSVLYGLWRKRNTFVLTDRRVLVGKGIFGRHER